MTRRAYSAKVVRVIRRQRVASLKIFKKRQMYDFEGVFLKYLKSLQIVQALRIFPPQILLLSLIPQKDNSSYRLYVNNKLRPNFVFGVIFESFLGFFRIRRSGRLLMVSGDPDCLEQLLVISLEPKRLICHIFIKNDSQSLLG